MNSQDCIFCKIASGELPAYKIYEDDQFLAFLDIFPLTPGHTLVIPKQHYRWVWDVEPAEEYWQVIRKIAKHFQTVLNDDFLPSMTVGNEVPHAHYHLLPIGEGTTKVLTAMGQSKSTEKLPDDKAQDIFAKLALNK